MKCPKCGFNSFEFLDSCKKCGNALTPFKKDHGIRAVILPSRQTAVAAAEPGTAPVPENALPEGGADQFTWEPASAAEPAGPAGDNSAGFGPELAVIETAGERGAFDFATSSAGNGSSGNFATFSFDEPAEPQEPAGPGYGDASGGEELADLLESSGPAGNWGGAAGPAPSGGFSAREFEGFAEAFTLDEAGSGAVAGPSASGEVELDVFPFETESASPEKGKPTGGETGGPAADAFDELFEADGPDSR